MKIQQLATLVLIALWILIFSAAAQAQQPITFQWGDQPPGTPEVSGYRIYKVNKEFPTPEGPEIVTYTQVNAEAIPGTARSYTLNTAQPGESYTIRAYNAGGDGPHSEPFTIPAPPAAVPEFKAVALIVESSPDFIKWGTYAVLNVAAIPPAQFFRLRW